MQSSVSSTPKNTPGKLSLRTVRNAIFRHPFLVTGLLALAIATAASAWVFMPLSKNTGVLSFQISTNAPRVITASPENQTDLRTYGNLQAATLKRRQFLSNVLKHPEMKKAVSVSEQPEPVAWLEKNVQVDFKNGPEFMRVTVEGDDPDELLAILKAVMDTYEKAVDERDNGNRTQRLVLIEQAITKYQEEISRNSARIGVIASTLKTTDAATLLLIEGLNRSQLLVAQKEFSDLQHKLELVKLDLLNTTESSATLLIPPSRIEDAMRKESVNLTAADTKVSAAKQTLRDTKARYEAGITNPNITRAEAELKASEESRDKLQKTLRAQAEADIKLQLETEARDKLLRKKEEHDQIVRLLAIAEGETKTIIERIEKHGTYQTELESLRKAVGSTDKMLAKLSDERDLLRVEEKAPRRVIKTEEPFVQSGVEGYRRLRMLLMTSLGVLFIGFASLVWWEHRGRRVTRTDELDSSLGLPVLGSIPVSKPDEQRANRVLIEAVDAIRTQLLHARSKERPLRTMLICSGLSGEGKTTLSGHLTVSLARAGYRVLMVDGDLHAPTAQRLFDLHLNPGLCEVLRGESPSEDAIRATPVPGLFVMPAGTWNMATRQCLVGDRWENVRDQLQTEFDFIVVDTAPALLMADTLLLAKACDGVIFSVLLGLSRLGAIRLTQERFQTMGVRILGAVVNGAATEYASEYYGRYKYKYSSPPLIIDQAPVPLTVA